MTSQSISTLFTCLVALSCLSVVFTSDSNDDDVAYKPSASTSGTSSTSYVSAPSTSYSAENTYAQPVVGSKLIYHGFYAGACSQDGFYVNGPYSLVVCSNGRAHVQPCAPGTRNSARAYVPGVAYLATDFCDENLNNYAGSLPTAVAAGVPYYPVLPYPYGAVYAGYPYIA